MRQIFPLAVAIAAVVAAYVFDLPKSFGAHPWWSQKVVLFGGMAGLVLGGLLRQMPIPLKSRLAVIALAAAVATFATYFGKTQFAASYAEDAVAGRMWYFGWIATTTALTAIFYTIIGAVWHKAG